MKKPRLEHGDLRVESFATDGADGQRGTVLGRTPASFRGQPC